MRINSLPSATLLITLFISGVGTIVAGAPRILDAKMHHLRIGDTREWAEFPEQAESDKLEIQFNAKRNEKVHCLRLRLIDVRHRWYVTLNGKRLGDLGHDENPMLAYFAVPVGGLRDGENQLAIASTEISGLNQAPSCDGQSYESVHESFQSQP